MEEGMVGQCIGETRGEMAMVGGGEQDKGGKIADACAALLPRTRALRMEERRGTR